MMAKLWLCMDVLGVADDAGLVPMRSAMSDNWKRRGGKEHIEKIRTEYPITKTLDGTHPVTVLEWIEK